MTLDQLFVEAGGYLDQLIDARRSAGDAAPSAELRPRSRSWGRMAAAVVAMAGIVGLVMVIGGHQERPSSPDVTRPHLGAPSVFDTGADIAVFINPAATAEQVGLDMSETARAVGAVGKVVQIEYLPADKAVNEARRVMGFDPPDPPGISPAFTPTLLRVWVSLDTGGSVPDLAKSLMALPNVLAVWTSDMQVTGQYPLCCYGGAPATTLAPLTTDPGSTEVAPAVNSAIQAHLVPLLTGLTQLGFDQSEYTTNPRSTIARSPLRSNPFSLAVVERERSAETSRRGLGAHQWRLAQRCSCRPRAIFAS